MLFVQCWTMQWITDVPHRCWITITQVLNYYPIVGSNCYLMDHWYWLKVLDPRGTFTSVIMSIMMTGMIITGLNLMVYMMVIVTLKANYLAQTRWLFYWCADYSVNLESLSWICMPNSVPIDKIFYSWTKFLQMMHCFIRILDYAYIWFASIWLNKHPTSNDIFSHQFLSFGFVYDLYDMHLYEICQGIPLLVVYSNVWSIAIYLFHDKLVDNICTRLKVDCYVVSCIVIIAFYYCQWVQTIIVIYDIYYLDWNHLQELTFRCCCWKEAHCMKTFTDITHKLIPSWTSVHIKHLSHVQIKRLSQDISI